jgi:hypothetical protein
VRIVKVRLKPCPSQNLGGALLRGRVRDPAPHEQKTLAAAAGAAATHAAVAAAVSGHDAAAEAAGGGVSEVDNAGEGVGGVDAAGSGLARAGFGTADQGQRGLSADSVGLDGWGVRCAVGDARSEAFE